MRLPRLAALTDLTDLVVLRRQLPDSLTVKFSLEAPGIPNRLQSLHRPLLTADADYLCAALSRTKVRVVNRLEILPGINVCYTSRVKLTAVRYNRITHSFEVTFGYDNAAMTCAHIKAIIKAVTTTMTESINRLGGGIFHVTTTATAIATQSFPSAHLAAA